MGNVEFIVDFEWFWVNPLFTSNQYFPGAGTSLTSLGLFVKEIFFEISQSSIWLYKNVRKKSKTMKWYINHVNCRNLWHNLCDFEKSTFHLQSVFSWSWKFSDKPRFVCQIYVIFAIFVNFYALDFHADFYACRLNSERFVESQRTNWKYKKVLHIFTHVFFLFCVILQIIFDKLKENHLKNVYKRMYIYHVSSIWYLLYILLLKF